MPPAFPTVTCVVQDILDKWLLCLANILLYIFFWFSLLWSWLIFAVEIILKTGESLIDVERAFWTHFTFYWNDTVPDRKLILLWAENFKTASYQKKMASEILQTT